MRILLVIGLFVLGAAAHANRDAFLRAIADDPTDETARLAFADWLDENGDPDRARFIRAQVYVRTHGTYLGWGMALSEGNDRSRMTPRAFVTGDAFTPQHKEPRPYDLVETTAVMRAERISRELFDRHWTEWVAEVSPMLRQKLRPQDTESRRLLTDLPGEKRRDEEKRWWYTRFRSGFLGALHVEDFKKFDAKALAAVFDAESSTITELALKGYAFDRVLAADFFRRHPQAERRLRGLLLTVPTDHGHTDALAGELLANPTSALEDLQLVLDEVDDRAAVDSTVLFESRLRSCFQAARPRRLFLNRGNRRTWERPTEENPEAPWVLLERLLEPNSRAVGERLGTLAIDLDMQMDPLTPTRMTDFLSSLAELETFRLAHSPGFALRPFFYDRTRDGLETRPRLAVLSWDGLDVRNYRPPKGAFPALRMLLEPWWRRRRSHDERLDRRVAKNAAHCPSALADLAVLGIEAKR